MREGAGMGAPRCETHQRAWTQGLPLSTTSQSPPSRTRTVTAQVYRWLAIAFVALVAVQFFLAGLGTFGLHQRVSDSDAFGPHQTVGMIINGVALVMLVVALIARLRRAQIIAVATLFVLCTVTGFFAGAGADDPNRALGAVHALIGATILAVSLWIVADGRRHAQGRSAATGPS